MYIPTQQERYRKVATITLFLCVIIPSGVVYGLALNGAQLDIMGCLFAFIWPIAIPLDCLGFNLMAATSISAFLQACAFFWLARSRKLKPKTRLTIAVTWGMFFALLLKIFIAFPPHTSADQRENSAGRMGYQLVDPSHSGKQ